MRNRWYDPNTGRFTQEDPIGYAGGSNLYAYAGNDPVTYSDPYGLRPGWLAALKKGLRICALCVRLLDSWGAEIPDEVVDVAEEIEDVAQQREEARRKKEQQQQQQKKKPTGPKPTKPTYREPKRIRTQSPRPPNTFKSPGIFMRGGWSIFDLIVVPEVCDYHPTAPQCTESA